MLEFACDEIQQNMDCFARNLGLECEGWDINGRWIQLWGKLDPHRVFAFLGEPNSPHQRLVARSFTLPFGGPGRRLEEWVYDLGEELAQLTPAQQAIVTLVGDRLEAAVLDEFRDAEQWLDLQYRLHVQWEPLEIPAALADQVEEIWLVGTDDDSIDITTNIFDQITPVPGVATCYQDIFDVREDFLADQARFGFVKFVTPEGDEVVVDRLVAWRLADETHWLTELWAEACQAAEQEGQDAPGGEHGHAG